MSSDKEIIKHLEKHKEGASVSDISEATGHTRATVAKYLELLKMQGMVDYREVGKAKLWTFSKSRKKILIAEDEHHIRRLIRVVLGDKKYDIIEAENGEEALEKVSEEMPDLILLDLMMPKIDGVEVCKQIKKNVLTRKIPVIMLTAKREMTDKIVGIRTGAEDYLTKPFEPQELRIRVQTFLEAKNKERNSVTNLPALANTVTKLRRIDEDSEVFILLFKNLKQYQNTYGLSKTNEMVRLTTQIITHIIEKLGENTFVGHDSGHNFIIAIGNEGSKSVLKEIQNEFELTLPYFYGVDFENIDVKKKEVSQMLPSGKSKKMPLVSLEAHALSDEDIKEPEALQKKVDSL